jgi:hypothetical protein
MLVTFSVNKPCVLHFKAFLTFNNGNVTARSIGIDLKLRPRTGFNPTGVKNHALCLLLTLSPEFHACGLKTWLLRERWKGQKLHIFPSVILPE